MRMSTGRKSLNLSALWLSLFLLVHVVVLGTNTVTVTAEAPTEAGQNLDPDQDQSIPVDPNGTENVSELPTDNESNASTSDIPEDTEIEGASDAPEPEVAAQKEKGGEKGEAEKETLTSTEAEKEAKEMPASTSEEASSSPPAEGADSTTSSSSSIAPVVEDPLVELEASPSRRQNFCERYHEMRKIDDNNANANEENGNGHEIGAENTHWEKALQGLTLNILLQKGLYVQVNATTGTISNSSFLVRVMDELADRAGFSWRHSYRAIAGPLLNQTKSKSTWTKQLYAGVHKYDLYVGSWARNRVREKKSVAFTKPIFDDSIILVGKNPDHIPPTQNAKQSARFLSKLSDWLTYLLWKLLLLGIVTSGIYQQYLEAQDLKAQQDKDWKQEKWETFLYYKQYFTQEFTWTKDNVHEALMDLVEYQATTPMGRIFAATIVLWVLVQTGTRTAKTVQFFLPKRQTTPLQKAVPTPVTDIADAIQRKYSICTVATTNADIYIRKTYPEAQRVLKGTPQEAIAAVLWGKDECQLAVTVVDAWKEYQYDPTINPHLTSLMQMGTDVVASFEAGFALQADVDDDDGGGTEHYCTSLIQSTLDIHLTNMLQDGFMDQVWNDHLPKPPPPQAAANMEDDSCLVDGESGRGNGSNICTTSSSSTTEEDGSTPPVSLSHPSADPSRTMGEGASYYSSLYGLTGDASSYYQYISAKASQQQQQEQVQQRGERGAKNQHHTRPLWQRVFFLILSPLSWWRLFKWCFTTFWSFVFKSIMTMVVLGLAGSFSYSIMVMQVYADNYMDRKVIDDDIESVASRGRSRTPRPLGTNVNNPYKPGIGRGGNIVI